MRIAPPSGVAVSSCWLDIFLNPPITSAARRATRPRRRPIAGTRLRRAGAFACILLSRERRSPLVSRDPRQGIVRTFVEPANRLAVEARFVDFEVRAEQERRRHVLDRESDRLRGGVESPIVDQLPAR